MNKEENKYYTPLIEEFTFNIDWEYLAPSGVWICAKGIISGAFKLNFDNINTVFGKKESRIKFLDQEDIENLGWEIESLGSAKLGDWYLEANMPNIKEDTIEIYLVSDIRFRGTIKNKSELKVLMKQLGIQ